MSASEIREAGVSIAAVRDAGFGPDEIRDAGYSNIFHLEIELKSMFVCRWTTTEMRQAGYCTAIDVIVSRATLTASMPNLRQLRYTTEELKIALLATPVADY